jgi:hypothetical protein
MLALTSDQLGQPRQNSATSRPTRLQGATEEQILAFFLRFTLEERVARFGAATSDDAIRAWRDGLDRSHYVAVSLKQGHRIVGLVELFGSRLTGWQRPELAVSIHGVRTNPRSEFVCWKLALVLHASAGRQMSTSLSNPLRAASLPLLASTVGLSTIKPGWRSSPAASFPWMA